MNPGAVVMMTAVFAIASFAAGAFIGWRLGRRPGVEEMAYPAFNPALDRSETAARQAWEWEDRT